jgi:hypothetical protein
MNVLIDANVVFEVVEKRRPHYAASNQLKDFKLSHVPAVTPADYLERFHLA